MSQTIEYILEVLDMKVTRMVSAALASVMFFASLCALPAEASEAVFIDYWQYIPSDCDYISTAYAFSPATKFTGYDTTPDTYEYMDQGIVEGTSEYNEETGEYISGDEGMGWGNVYCECSRYGISFSSDSPISESFTLGDFSIDMGTDGWKTYRGSTPWQPRDPYRIICLPQSLFLAGMETNALYVLHDNDLTNAWKIRLQLPDETLPDDSNYIMMQTTYGMGTLDDQEAFFQLYDALKNDPRFTVNGFVYRVHQELGEYGHDIMVKDYAEAKDDIEAALIGLGLSGDIAYEDGDVAAYKCWSASKAKAILEQFEDDPRIGLMYPSVNYTPVAVDLSPWGQLNHVVLLPDRLPGSGDLTGDGSTDIADAVALARFNAEDESLDKSALNLDEADLNAGGSVDALDLAMLIEQLAGNI